MDQHREAEGIDDWDSQTGAVGTLAVLLLELSLQGKHPIYPAGLGIQTLLLAEWQPPASHAEGSLAQLLQPVPYGAKMNFLGEVLATGSLCPEQKDT